MAEEIKICKLIIKDFEQFKDIELDFTDPKTGEPLDKICLIGRNGTGKSKLLKIIESVFSFSNPSYLFLGTVYAKLKVGSNYFYCLKSTINNQIHSTGSPVYLSETVDSEGDWIKKIRVEGKSFLDKHL